MARTTGRTSIIPDGVMHMAKGDVFMILGHKFDNISTIAEMLDPSSLTKKIVWITHDGRKDGFQFQNEEISEEDLIALVVALRMS